MSFQVPKKKMEYSGSDSNADVLISTNELRTLTAGAKECFYQSTQVKLLKLELEKLRSRCEKAKRISTRTNESRKLYPSFTKIPTKQIEFRYEASNTNNKVLSPAQLVKRPLPKKPDFGLYSRRPAPELSLHRMTRTKLERENAEISTTTSIQPKVKFIESCVMINFELYNFDDFFGLTDINPILQFEKFNSELKRKVESNQGYLANMNGPLYLVVFHNQNLSIANLVQLAFECFCDLRKFLDSYLDDKGMSSLDYNMVMHAGESFLTEKPNQELCVYGKAVKNTRNILQHSENFGHRVSILSGRVYNIFSAKETTLLRRIGKLYIHSGKRRRETNQINGLHLHLYQVLGKETEYINFHEKKLEISSFEEALEYFEAGRYEKAETIFLRISDAYHGKDSACSMYALKCREEIESELKSDIGSFFSADDEINAHSDFKSKANSFDLRKTLSGLDKNATNLEKACHILQKVKDDESIPYNFIEGLGFIENTLIGKIRPHSINLPTKRRRMAVSLSCQNVYDNNDKPDNAANKETIDTDVARWLLTSVFQDAFDEGDNETDENTKKQGIGNIARETNVFFNSKKNGHDHDDKEPSDITEAMVLEIDEWFKLRNSYKRGSINANYKTDCLNKNRSWCNQLVLLILKNWADWNEFSVFDVERASHNNPLFPMSICFIKHWEFNHLFSNGVNERKLWKYIHEIEQLYKSDIAYHNSTHAADVLHSVHYTLSMGGLQKRYRFTELQVLASLISAIVHDVGHPGRTNQFLVQTSNTLAIRYNDTTVLENFHCATAFDVLSKQSSNFLEGVDSADRQIFRKLVIEMVLATELLKSFELVGRFKTITNSMEPSSFASTKKIDNPEFKLLVLKMTIKVADISNPCRNVKEAKEWSRRIFTEFYDQGDEEKGLGLPISAFCDREQGKDVKSKCQLSFIQYLVEPAMTPFTKLLSPNLDIWMENMRNVRGYWEKYVDSSDI